MVKRGSDAGVRFTLESAITQAGRHPESDIFLDDITVSRRHAEFVTRDQVTTVRDVGSLNGTYVNRERIEEARLSSGDEVQIGKFKLLYLSGGRRMRAPLVPAVTRRAATMSARSYLSIGDVLTLLRQEFPDVTISKIRFLESQGLVNPERTPSGYRKFYEHDVERLRWVLRQQREHFLPLKVIKDRLDDDADGSVTADSPLAAAASRPVTASTGPVD